MSNQTRGREVIDRQISTALDGFGRSTTALVLSSFAAGLEVGFGPLFVAAVLSVADGVWSVPTVRVAMAAAYSVGFVFVVLGGTELFTEHTMLAVLPVLDGQAAVGTLARLWGLVYAGNVLGGLCFAAGAVVLAPAYGLAEVAAFGHVASPLVTGSAGLLLAGGVAAGWLMGLLTWLVTVADSTGARLAVVVLVTTVIGFGHLPHAVAGNVEVAMAVATDAVSVDDYLRYQLLATVGNVVGGSVFVALLKYGYVRAA